jgi:hypothetical protein
LIKWGWDPSFGRGGVLLLANVLDIAHTWISEQTQNES